MKGKKFYMYTPAETVEYEQRVGTFAKIAMQGRTPLSCLVAVKMRLFFSESEPLLSGRKKTPDIDNCVKSILDGMKEIVYVDDVWVDKLKDVERVWNTPPDQERAEVEIQAIGHEKKVLAPED